MGVTDLWNILGEIAERKPLKHLSGKKIAVDLSGWILQAKKCGGLNSYNNPFLRPLFFRVSRLLKDGALPIFVMEGDVPALKKDALKKRKKQHFNDDNLDRKQFEKDLLLRQELLNTLGVPCIKASGEAEAFCAFLCIHGVVEGVISEDSDAFLYGADSVYRDFTSDKNKDPHVDLYSLKSEKNKHNLDRKKLIALALLLGCVYDEIGVPGVGEKAALKLLSELSDCDLLQRFKDWKEKSESVLFPGYEENIKKPTHCKHCEHLGSSARHKKNGCEDCESKLTCYLPNKTNKCTCAWHKSNEISINRKAELKIYNAVKELPDFPNSEIIDEYLCYSDVIPDKDSLEWKCPNLQQFQEKIFNYWSWTVEKSFEKCFPIITSWHQYKVTSSSEKDKSCLLYEPIQILKKCVEEKEPCFKVQWKKITEDDCVDLITTECQERFTKAYPEIAETFFSSLKQKNSKSPDKKIKAKASDKDNKCQKMTAFFQPTPRECTKDSEELIHQASTSKRHIEDLYDNEQCTKKQCVG